MDVIFLVVLISSKFVINQMPWQLADHLLDHRPAIQNRTSNQQGFQQKVHVFCIFMVGTWEAEKQPLDDSEDEKLRLLHYKKK